MYKVVIQEQPTGCGIASVANVVGQSYAEVKAVANALGIFAEDPALWSDTAYVRRLLQYFGISCSSHEQPFVDWQTLPDQALLAIKYHQHDGQYFWHWVVFKRIHDREMVLDSAAYLPSNLRLDFADMQPKWFIAVDCNRQQP